MFCCWVTRAALEGGGERKWKRASEGAALDSALIPHPFAHSSTHPPESPPSKRSIWPDDDEAYTAWIGKLVAVANLNGITHRTIGASMYLALVASKEYDEKGVIGFRASPLQEFHGLYLACMLLETLDTTMIPGTVPGTSVATHLYYILRTYVGLGSDAYMPCRRAIWTAWPDYATW